MSKIVQANKKVEKAVVGSYKKVEDTVVGGYKKIEDGVVSVYQKVEDKFIDTFLAQEGETTKEAKDRIMKDKEQRKQETHNRRANG